MAQVSDVEDDLSKLVLKVAPPGLPPVRNRDVLRQSRLLQVLYGQPGVVVPPVYFDDDGDPPFMAMGFVAGECVEPILESSRDPGSFPQTRARAFDAIAVLAALHRVDPSLVGDEPVVTLADEITGGRTRSPRCRRTGRGRTSGALPCCTRPCRRPFRPS